MTNLACPWCEAVLEGSAEGVEQQCPECLTSWIYEDDELDLPIAA